MEENFSNVDPIYAKQRQREVEEKVNVLLEKELVERKHNLTYVWSRNVVKNVFWS